MGCLEQGALNRASSDYTDIEMMGVPMIEQENKKNIKNSKLITKTKQYQLVTTPTNQYLPELDLTNCKFIYLFIYTVLIERAIHNSMCSNSLKLL